jgi:hypothetical protein
MKRQMDEQERMRTFLAKQVAEKKEREQNDKANIN